jgi:hypothetical protein
MMFQDPPRDSELEALLEQGRVIRPLPDVVRARSLTRARATVATATVLLPEPMPMVRMRLLPIAIAAGLALVVGATVAVAALRSQSPRSHQPVPATSPRVLPPERVSAINLPELPSEDSTSGQLAAAQGPSPTKQARRTGRLPTALESDTAELELLQRAQTAYVRRDFSGALALVAEHGRRFPNGRLTEEREALRVRLLASSGRDDEANRAAAAFANRFPRSALLPTGQNPKTGP